MVEWISSDKLSTSSKEFFEKVYSYESSSDRLTDPLRSSPDEDILEDWSGHSSDPLPEPSVKRRPTVGDMVRIIDESYKDEKYTDGGLKFGAILEVSDVGEENAAYPIEAKYLDEDGWEGKEWFRYKEVELVEGPMFSGGKIENQE